MSQKQGGKGVTLPTKWTKKDVTASVLAASLAAFGLTSQQPADLIRMEVDPCAFHHPESFRRAYWATEMWSKFPFQLAGVDREAAALESFRNAESRAGDTNRRLVDLFNRSDVPPAIRQVLVQARRRLERLFAGFSVNEIASHARWGPGSSTALPARCSTLQNKWVFASHITQSAIPYLDAWVSYSGWNLATEPELIHGNAVTFVPKNAKTDRAIAIEPCWNMFFQLGLGGAIRSRLQRWGVLLPIAQRVNQCLARKGSTDGFLATIDLKGASDSIALALVEALLPSDVLTHVLNLRSPFGTLDDGATWFPYEKVSSMGNGATFELETALFWAICSEAAGHAMVYGDDIIVPNTTVAFVVEVLNFCGFEVNLKKTHFDSPFRESCGGHYFKGVDVTPVYVREELTGIERLAFANNLRRKISDQMLLELAPVWDAAARGIPRVFRGPSTVDGVLHDEFDRAVPQWCTRYKCHTGKRLLRVYDLGQSLQLGGLRAALFAQEPCSFSYSRLPGVACDVIRDWFDDGYGEEHLPGTTLLLAELRPLQPRWRGGPLVS